MSFNVDYSKNSFIWDFIKETKSEDSAIPNEEVTFVRDVVLSWLNERFLPNKESFTIFDKCVYLFHNENLLNILNEYRVFLNKGLNHWIEYIHTLSFEFLKSFTATELDEILLKYDIDWYTFITKVFCISGVTEIIRLNNECDVKKIVEHAGDFCGGIYISETSEILSNNYLNKLSENKDALRLKIIFYLNSRNIPTEYKEPLLFDKCTQEEVEELFCFSPKFRN